VNDDQFIHCHPDEIKERKVAGHWEGDLIAGSKNQSCIETLVESATGYLILSKMKILMAYSDSIYQRAKTYLYIAKQSWIELSGY